MTTHYESLETPENGHPSGRAAGPRRLPRDAIQIEDRRSYDT